MTLDTSNKHPVLNCGDLATDFHLLARQSPDCDVRAHGKGDFTLIRIQGKAYAVCPPVVAYVKANPERFPR